MLDESNLSEPQQAFVDRLYAYDITYAIAETGFGKTVCTLTAIKELINNNNIKKVLIVAPLKPCHTVWAKEHVKWDHLTGLRVNVAVGDQTERISAITGDCDICVINFDNLVWFIKTFGAKHGFDGIVIDEMTKLKEGSSALVKKLRYRINDFTWRVGLTATPVAEGFEGLFSQVLCLDGGMRYGKNKQLFLNKYFYATDYNQYNWEVREDSIPSLMSNISDLLFVAGSYNHELPKLIEKQFKFNLCGLAGDQYAAFKRSSVMDCGGTTVVAENAAVLSGKLEQLSNGFLYLEGNGCLDVHRFHNHRMYALRDFMSTLPEGINILIFYKFTEDKERLLDYLSGRGVRVLASKQDEDDWNSGKIPVLLAHPKSASHGLNLQGGGHTIIWFSPEWSNDVFTQANARLHRRGQLEDVTVTTLVASGTVNEITVLRMEDKREVEALFKHHIT